MSDNSLGERVSARVSHPHTPGPWKRNSAFHLPIYAGGDGDFTYIAYCIARDVPSVVAEANCHLICAAPDILAALEAVYDAGVIVPVALLEQARVAIAKARGGIL